MGWVPLLLLGEDGLSITVPVEAQDCLSAAAPTPSTLTLVAVDGVALASDLTGSTTLPRTATADSVGVWLWSRPLRTASKKRAREAPSAVMCVEISRALRRSSEATEVGPSSSLSLPGGGDLRLLLGVLLSCSVVVQAAPRSSWIAQHQLLQEWSALSGISNLIEPPFGDKGDESWIASLMPQLVWLLEPPTEAADRSGGGGGGISSTAVKLKTAMQRLESCLASEGGYSDAKNRRNRARALVKQLFRRRHAMVALCPPSASLQDNARQKKNGAEEEAAACSGSSDSRCSGGDGEGALPGLLKLTDVAAASALTDFLLGPAALPRSALSFSSGGQNLSSLVESSPPLSSSGMALNEVSPPLSGPMLVAMLRDIAESMSSRQPSLRMAAPGVSPGAPASASTSTSAPPFVVPLLPAHATALAVLASDARGAAMVAWRDEIQRRLGATFYSSVVSTASKQATEAEMGNKAVDGGGGGGGGGGEKVAQFKAPVETELLLVALDECHDVAELTFAAIASGCSGGAAGKTRAAEFEGLRWHLAQEAALLVAANHEASQIACAAVAIAAMRDLLGAAFATAGFGSSGGSGEGPPHEGRSIKSERYGGLFSACDELENDDRKDSQLGDDDDDDDSKEGKADVEDEGSGGDDRSRNRDQDRDQYQFQEGNNANHDDWFHTEGSETGNSTSSTSSGGGNDEPMDTKEPLPKRNIATDVAELIKRHASAALNSTAAASTQRLADAAAVAAAARRQEDERVRKEAAIEMAGRQATTRRHEATLEALKRRLETVLLQRFEDDERAKGPAKWPVMLAVLFGSSISFSRNISLPTSTCSSRSIWSSGGDGPGRDQPGGRADKGDGEPENNGEEEKKKKEMQEEIDEYGSVGPWSALAAAVSEPLKGLATEYAALRTSLRSRIGDDHAAANAVAAELSRLDAQRVSDRAAQMAAVAELLSRGEAARAAVEAAVHSLEMEVSDITSRAVRVDVLKRKKVATAIGRVEQAKERAGLLNAKVRL